VQTIAKCLNERRLRAASRAAQVTDAVKLDLRLRLRRKRHPCRSANQRDELAPPEVDCHATGCEGHAMQWRDDNHALPKDEQCFCAAKLLRA
jgi:hypothetical protein